MATTLTLYYKRSLRPGEPFGPHDGSLIPSKPTLYEPEGRASQGARVVLKPLLRVLFPLASTYPEPE